MTAMEPAGPMDDARDVSSESVGGVPVARFLRLTVLVVLAAVVSIYLPVYGFEFLNYDDNDYVALNPDIQQGLTWTSFKAVFTSSYVASWHPLAMVSHALDVSLFGMNPGPHHLSSVFFHALNCVLLLLAVHRLTGRPVESAILVAIWAVHPQHVEPVAWISSRKDLLSTMFMCIALYAYADYTRAPGWIRYAAVAASMVLGLLAKPMLVTFPFVLLLLDCWPLNRYTDAKAVRRCVLEKLPLLGLCVAFMAVTQLVQTGGGAVKGLDLVPMPARIANAFISYQAYVVKFFWPLNISPYYPHTLDRTTPVQVGVAVTAVVLLCGLALAQVRRRPYVFVGWFWFFGSLVPVIGLVQFGSHGMADRYTYVSHIGLLMAVIWTAGEFFQRVPSMRRGLVIGLTALCIGFAVLSGRYVHAYRNDVTLFRHARSVVGDHSVIALNLGMGLIAKGAYAEGLHLLREGLDMRPEVTNLHNNIGVCYAAMGRNDLAYQSFVDALAHDPSDSKALHNIDFERAQLDRFVEEARGYEEYVRDHPEDLAAISGLAMRWFNLGMLDMAAEAYRFLIQTDPNVPHAHERLAVIETYRGNRAEAIGHYQKALALGGDPGEILYPLGTLFRETGNDVEARRVLEEALRLNPPSLNAEFYLDRTWPTWQAK